MKQIRTPQKPGPQLVCNGTVSVQFAYLHAYMTEQTQTHCRSLAQRGPQLVCNGTVSVQFAYDSVGPPKQDNDTRIIWGIGNHPLDLNYKKQNLCLNATVRNRMFQFRRTATCKIIVGRYPVFNGFAGVNWYKKPLKAVEPPSIISEVAVHIISEDDVLDLILEVFCWMVFCWPVGLSNKKTWFSQQHRHAGGISVQHASVSLDHDMY